MFTRPIRRFLILLLVATSLGCGSDSSGGSSGPAPLASDDPIAIAIVAAHNTARANVIPQPQTPIPNLGWSEDAAAAAQSWANRCTWGHDPKLGSLSMGQNIYTVANSTGKYDTNPADVVGSWAGEGVDYDYASNTCAAGKVCGHYTAVVWRNTTGTGCGHRVCTTGSPFAGYPTWDFWVCNYVPAGNYLGQKPY